MLLAVTIIQNYRRKRTTWAASGETTRRLEPSQSISDSPVETSIWTVLDKTTDPPRTDWCNFRHVTIRSLDWTALNVEFAPGVPPTYPEGLGLTSLEMMEALSGAWMSVTGKTALRTKRPRWNAIRTVVGLHLSVSLEEYPYLLQRPTLWILRILQIVIVLIILSFS